MKIVVPVKNVGVLDEEFELEPGATEVDPDDLDWELNEWDLYSLEAALSAAEQVDGSEVVVVTVGDEEADEALLGGLARGAARGIRIEADGVDLRDPLAVARALAGPIQAEGPDLVLCGVQSSDAANTATGVALSGLLDLPAVAVVTELTVDDGAGTALVRRELEGGRTELLRVGLPALLTIQTGQKEPRYASLRAIKQAREKPLAVVSLEEAGTSQEEVVAAAGARTVSLSRPSSEGAAELINGSAAEIAQRISEIVKERVQG